MIGAAPEKGLSHHSMCIKCIKYMKTSPYYGDLSLSALPASRSSFNGRPAQGLPDSSSRYNSSPPKKICPLLRNITYIVPFYSGGGGILIVRGWRGRLLGDEVNKCDFTFRLGFNGFKFPNSKNISKDDPIDIWCSITGPP